MTGKTLILGTAMWGWSVRKDPAFSLLDEFYQAGGRFVDTATNYPINKDPACFRFAENVLFEWIKLRKPPSLNIIMKIGSLSNDGSSANDLSPEFIASSAKTYKDKFGQYLHALCLHWDNRSESAAVKASLEALRSAAAAPTLWLSGIKHPEVYAESVPDMPCTFNIQVKHNLFYSDLPRYRLLRSRAAFYAYGLNAGGAGLSPAPRSGSSARLRGIDASKYEGYIGKLKEVIRRSEAAGFTLTTLNELSLLNTWMTQGIEGIIIGPSDRKQLEQTMNFVRRLEDTGAEDGYRRIVRELSTIGRSPGTGL